MNIIIRRFSTDEILFQGEYADVKACVTAANERKVNLCGADLCGADLRCADLDRATLCDANLTDAYLHGADLGGVRDVIDLGQPDGWSAFGWHQKDTIMIQVGCRSFTLAEGRAYWAGKENRREVLAALDYCEAVARIRRWETAQ